MKYCLKSILSLILVATILIVTTSCAFPRAECVLEKAEDLADNLSSKADTDPFSATDKELFLEKIAEENSSITIEKVNDFISDVKEEILSQESTSISTTTSDADLSSSDESLDLSEEEMAEFLLCLEEFKKQDIFSFATDCVASTSMVPAMTFSARSQSWVKRWFPA